MRLNTYQTPEKQFGNSQRRSLIMQSSNNKSVILDPVLEELKSEWQSIKLNSMVNGSSNITSFRIDTHIKNMQDKIRHMPKDEQEIKLLNAYILQYNKMLSLDGPKKRKNNLSLSIDSTDYNRSKQIVQRNINSLGTLYKDIKNKASQFHPLFPHPPQLYRSSIKSYRIRHSSYIPASHTRPDTSELKTPIRIKMNKCLLDLSRDCNKLLGKSKKLRVSTILAEQSINASLSECRESIAKTENENKKGVVHIKYLRHR